METCSDKKCLKKGCHSSYEKNQPETYIKNLVSSIEEDPVKYGNVKKEYGESYKNFLKNKDIKIEENENSWKVIVNDRHLFNVTLNEGKQVSKLGLLSYNILSTKDIEPLNDHGVYYYLVKIPSSFKLVVNGNEITDHDSEEIIEDFDEIIEDFDEIIHDAYPKNYVYHLDNLATEPKIEIYNNKDELVDYYEANNYITSLDFYKTDDYNKYIFKEFDVIAFAKKWSLNLTNDLAGGFSSLKNNLIEGNKMHTMAKDWSIGADKNFVSNHYLKNPIFTNVSVKNCHIYNEVAFSCHVILEKNMVVNGKDKIEKLNDRMFFLYDDGWKFVDMHFVGE